MSFFLNKSVKSSPKLRAEFLVFSFGFLLKTQTKGRVGVGAGVPVGAAVGVGLGVFWCGCGCGYGCWCISALVWVWERGHEVLSFFIFRIFREFFLFEKKFLVFSFEFCRLLKTKN